MLRVTRAAGAAATTALLLLAGLHAPASWAATSTVTGQVLTWSGRGATGLTVHAQIWLKRTPDAAPPEYELTALTDAAGQFTFVPPVDSTQGGSFTWKVTVPNGGLTRTHWLTLPVASSPTRILFQLNDAPSPPASLTAIPGDGTADLTWTPPLLTGGLPVTSYTAAFITRAGVISTCTTAGDGTGCQLTGLPNGTPGHVQVTATNDVGEGPGIWTALTPDRPQPPVAPTPTASPPPPVRKRPVVRLTNGTHQPGHRLTLRWTARHTDTVRLTWRRGHGRPHSQLTSPTGRITLAGPPGTVYRVTAAAGGARAVKTYRIR